LTQMLEADTNANVTITAETTVDADGYTAIRVNLPPIGFNKARVKIEIEDVDEAVNLIDLEVPAVVIIDPGHGGDDPGAVGRTDNTILEKDLALAYSLKFQEELIDKFKEEGFALRVVMTRTTTNQFPSLLARPRVAKKKGADIFVSIHFNASAINNGIYARGTETFVERIAAQASAENPGDNKNVGEDEGLASALNATTLAAVAASDAGATDRGVKRAGKAVTRDGANYNGNTTSYHPIKACLIEVEFLSNEAALNSVNLANATGTAIKDHFAENAANDVFNNLSNQQ